jgi:23S rRNA (adenine2503-C2)-methyltransferase
MAISTKHNDILRLSREELRDWFLDQGEKKFRADQVYDWLWKKGMGDFGEMSNLSKALREKLEASFSLAKITVDNVQVSRDGTRKYAFRLAGGQQVEGVLIPTSSRVTACISSQAGCSLDCTFCATGLLDLKHNLHHYEIYDQIFYLYQESEKYFGRPLSNIVYMGMGEPLLNYRNVMRSIHFVCSEDGLGMSPRRITVSTSGIAKMIKRLGDDGAKFEFALSLHSAIDEVRSRIMPINDSNNLESLKEALIYFYEKTGTRVTYEYCVFEGVNDSIEAARALADFSRIIPSKINLIEYNPFPESGFVNASPERMGRFIKYLEDQRLIVNVRRSRGRDIDGGCGQLALRHSER